MQRYNTAGVLITLLIIFALVITACVFARQARTAQQRYTDREDTLHSYNLSNYYVNAELYAVKPDGTEVVEDTNGKLWEVEGLKITRHDRLLLEVRNDTVVKVYVHSWEKPAQ